jgi:hypothetical protein
MTYSNKLTVRLRAGRNPNIKEPPHEAFANMQDDRAAAWAFYDRWGPLMTESPTSPEQLESFYRAKNFPCPVIDLELRTALRQAWRGEKAGEGELPVRYIEDSAGRYMKFSWIFKAGKAELVAEDLWSAICVLFLRDRAAHKTAVCENPDCPAPYFIRKRKTQKFCEAGPCVEYGARLRANKWWKAHGNEWRDTKRQKSNRKGKRTP